MAIASCPCVVLLLGAVAFLCASAQFTDEISLDELFAQTLANGTTTAAPTQPSVCPEGSTCLPYYLCGDGQLVDNRLILNDNSNPCRLILRCCPFADIHPERMTEAPLRHDDATGITQPTVITTKSPPVTSRPLTLKPSTATVPGISKCGIRNPDGVAFRLGNARDNEAEFAEFPWMVALFEETEVLGQTMPVYKCGGSLIHPQVVLTATHCVNKGRRIIARAGEWDTQGDDEILPKQDRRVAEVVLHEGFHKGGLFNDIALLRLETAIEPADNVGFVCLPKASAAFDSVQCVASGWGAHKQGDQETTILKKVQLPVVPRQRCQEQFRAWRKSADYELHESYLCAGGRPGQDTCKGDGGSPLVCPTMQAANQYVQAGIVSWGRGCGTADIPGVYANVAVLRDWIDAKMDAWGLGKDYYDY